MKLYLLSALLFASVSVLAQSSIPHLQRQGNAMQLVANEKPFLVLGSAGGENNIRIRMRQ